MKLKAIIVSSMMILIGTTSYAIAETSSAIKAPVVVEQEETWFGDAYEEDGCFCE